MNAVPNDPQSPFVTSGIRVGAPAVTTRGFEERDCQEQANWMCDLIDARGDQSVTTSVREEAAALCANYPVYA